VLRAYSCRVVPLLQHKTEAYWFYRILSLVYDRWVNPLFWTPAMRTTALDAARLEHRELRTLDVGAGTGFTTEGIVEHVDAGCVTMLDQSPHQLARARSKPALAECTKVLGDAEDLPFAGDAYDRYVSAGSIEYWPDPQRALVEAYRVLRSGGRALVIGPARPANPILRRLADTWMLFPPERDYRVWFERAGFADVAVITLAPPWYRSRRAPYALAVSGRKPAPGSSPLELPPPAERVLAAMRPTDRARAALRFGVGSLSGALFLPLAAALALRHRIQEGRGD
jgi:MPBQ/MSBQ methyltransferase